jgi:hypothetical protein
MPVKAYTMKRDRTPAATHLVSVTIFFEADDVSGACPVLGFVVDIRVRGDAPDARASAVARELLRLLESNGLVADRRGDRTYVVSRDGSQATDADRQLVAQWAGGWRDAAEIAISDLMDLTLVADP